MLSINISELVLTAISFFLLFFLLKHFLYAPLIRFMDERNARIEEGLDAEKQALAAVQANEMLLEAKRKESMDRAKHIAELARSADEQRREAVLQQARQSAEESRRRAREEACRLQESESGKLKADENALAALLADRLLSSGYAAGE